MNNNTINNIFITLALLLVFFSKEKFLLFNEKILITYQFSTYNEIFNFYSISMLYIIMLSIFWINFFKKVDPEIAEKVIKEIKRLEKKMKEYYIYLSPSMEDAIRKKIKEAEKKLKRKLTEKEIIIIIIGTVGIVLAITSIIIIVSKFTQ